MLTPYHIQRTNKLSDQDKMQIESMKSPRREQLSSKNPTSTNIKDKNLGAAVNKGHGACSEGHPSRRNRERTQNLPRNEGRRRSPAETKEPYKAAAMSVQPTIPSRLLLSVSLLFAGSIGEREQINGDKWQTGSAMAGNCRTPSAPTPLPPPPPLVDDTNARRPWRRLLFENPFYIYTYISYVCRN